MKEILGKQYMESVGLFKEIFRKIITMAVV